MTREALSEKLRGLPFNATEVEIEGGPGHFVVVVSTPDFTHQEEAERQQRVWSYLLENLSEEEQSGVEFVFTLSPQERQALANPTR